MSKATGSITLLLPGWDVRSWKGYLRISSGFRGNFPAPVYRAEFTFII